MKTRRHSCLCCVLATLLTAASTAGCRDDDEPSGSDDVNDTSGDGGASGEAGSGGESSTDAGSGVESTGDASSSGATTGDPGSGAESTGDSGSGGESSGDPGSGGETTGDLCVTKDDGSSTGPGQYTVSSIELIPGVDGATVYYPAELADSPCTFWVIGWGNGTSSTGGDAYPEYFNRLASHGFVVAVAHTNFAANGPVILDTAALVLAENDNPQSVFFGKLATAYGVMGKSQGAIAASRDVNTDPNAIAAVLVAGAVGSVAKPALFATGDEDFLKQQTLTGYEAATDTAVFAEAVTGVSHQDLDGNVAVAQLATSFMRCHLQQDAAACAYVACADCQVERWGAYQVK
jgi:hypothetical protein